ncbi:hypothetical protein C5Y93_25720 [Blastopirellula marina]|uniref:Leucine Rich repeats (2 copies) n=1 Tax=Blastopirellula marina TaxID=124 RepID=A0A2S8GF68_9BACT|nr:hypothetical protein C5Y93_25720 [Blastopirellula marina]
MEDVATNTSSPVQLKSPRRLLSRCLSVGLFLLIALPLTWVCFAGDMVCQGGITVFSSGGRPQYSQDWEHGWPYVFLNRNYNGYGSSPLAFGEGRLTLYWGCLLGDLFVYLTILGTLAWLCRGQRPDDRMRFSFTLRTALVGVTLFCLVTANVANSCLQSQREEEIRRQLSSAGQVVGPRYIGPRWYSRLGLNEFTPWKMEGIESINLRSTELGEMQLAAVYPKLAELSQLSILKLHDKTFSEEEIALLLTARRRWPIRQLSISNMNLTGHLLKDVQSLPAVEELSISSAALDDEGFAVISQWTSLESISIRKAAITAKSVKLAAEMPNLREINFYDTDISDADCEILKRRNIKFLTRASAFSVETAPDGSLRFVFGED